MCLAGSCWVMPVVLVGSGVRCDDAFDNDAFGFEVGDAVVGAVAHHDRFLEEGDERARGLGEPAIIG